ncbi:MAG: kynureninase [Proteobacteria bacterium]|nr:kynureninase [Pseudomonadota bacterium]
MNPEVLEQAARERDAADPLRGFRARFALPQAAGADGPVYLCGHSLGLMPLAARALVTEELDAWAQRAVEGHESGARPWIPYHENFAVPLAALTGAHPDEVVAMNSLTANLHFMLAAFYRPRGTRRRIVIEAGAFSSDRHAVASQIAWHGLDPQADLVELTPASGADLIEESAIEAYLAQHGPQVALVLWPSVQFRTGQVFDTARIAGAAHACGALVGFDLAHGIGNLPHRLHADQADFAVWCSYKYLNAGPGAIGGAFVHRRHLTAGVPGTRLEGWWGHEERTRFLMEPKFTAAAGAAAFQVSNPPILAAAPLLASLALFGEAGIEPLRRKSIALTAWLEELLAPLSGLVSLITPTDPARRGCQLSLRIAGGAQRGREVFERLTRAGVVGDWRAPDVIRLAPVPLYNSFLDVARGAVALTRAVRA